MLAAIIAFSLFGAPKPLPCPDAFTACQDTRSLTVTPGFTGALHDFVGEAHARYTYSDKPIYDQVMERLTSPEDHAISVGEGMRLFVGCKRMACPEKTAIIVDQSGIVAIGMIDYGHGEPSLEVLVQHGGDGAWASEQVLKDWAEAAVKHQAEHDHANTSLHDTRIRALADETVTAPEERKQRISLFTPPRL